MRAVAALCMACVAVAEPLQGSDELRWKGGMHEFSRNNNHALAAAMFWFEHNRGALYHANDPAQHTLRQSLEAHATRGHALLQNGDTGAAEKVFVEGIKAVSLYEYHKNYGHGIEELNAAESARLSGDQHCEVTSTILFSGTQNCNSSYEVWWRIGKAAWAAGNKYFDGHEDIRTAHTMMRRAEFALQITALIRSGSMYHLNAASDIAKMAADRPYQEIVKLLVNASRQSELVGYAMYITHTLPVLLKGIVVNAAENTGIINRLQFALHLELDVTGLPKRTSIDLHSVRIKQEHGSLQSAEDLMDAAAFEPGLVLLQNNVPGVIYPKAAHGRVTVREFLRALAAFEFYDRVVLTHKAQQFPNFKPSFLKFEFTSAAYSDKRPGILHVDDTEIHERRIFAGVVEELRTGSFRPVWKEGAVNTSPSTPESEQVIQIMLGTYASIGSFRFYNESYWSRLRDKRQPVQFVLGDGVVLLYRLLLAGIYHAHNTSKLHTIDSLLLRSTGKEYWLYKSICAKYGVKPEPKHAIVAQIRPAAVLRADQSVYGDVDWRSRTYTRMSAEQWWAEDTMNPNGELLRYPSDLKRDTRLRSADLTSLMGTGTASKAQNARNSEL